MWAKHFPSPVFWRWTEQWGWISDPLWLASYLLACLLISTSRLSDIWLTDQQINFRPKPTRGEQSHSPHVAGDYKPILYTVSPAAASESCTSIQHQEMNTFSLFLFVSCINSNWYMSVYGVCREVTYLRCWDQSAASQAVSSSSSPPGCHRDQPCPCGWLETWTAGCLDSYHALSPKKKK